MLVPFTDAEGRETWINALHVKVVRTRKGMLGGKKGAEVWFSWASSASAVNIPEDPATVSLKLNAALAQLPAPLFPPSDADDPDAGEPETQAKGS